MIIYVCNKVNDGGEAGRLARCQPVIVSMPIIVSMLVMIVLISTLLLILAIITI